MKSQGPLPCCHFRQRGRAREGAVDSTDAPFSIANLIMYAALLVLSYGLAEVAPFGQRQPRERAYFERAMKPFVHVSPAAVGAVRRYVAGDSPLARPLVRTTAYAVPLVGTTAVFLMLAGMLQRNRARIDNAVVSSLVRWSTAFVLMNLLAYPLCTQDLFYSMPWGRMILDGKNPYHQLVTPDSLANLPVKRFPFTMTYGPLWALTSAFLVALSGHRAAVEFIAFKLALGLFWVLTLWTIRATLADSPPERQAFGVCFFGWAPASVLFSIAEAHNDIAMMSLVGVWLWLLRRRKSFPAPVALTASILMKYVTLPLLAVDLLHSWNDRRRVARAQLAGIAASVLLGGVVFGLFWRGPHFFSSVVEMRDWTCFSPIYAIVSLGDWLDVRIPWTPVSVGVRLLCATAVLYWSWRYLREPSFERLTELVVAILFAVLFGIVTRVWPWFITWLLVPAAVAVGSSWWCLVVPLVLLFPFLNLFWMLAPGWAFLSYAAVPLYLLLPPAAALMWWAGRTARGTVSV
jgi:alpha-1,6-mannosyltransferase